MEVSTSFDTLSQSLSRHGNGSVASGGGGQAAKRRRREDQLESLRSTLRSLRSYQAEEAMAAGNTSTLESRGTLRGATGAAYPPMAATATVGGRRSFSRPPRPPSTAVSPSVASSSLAPGPPPVPLDVIAAVHEVMGAPSQSEFRGLGSTLSGGSRLTSRRGSGCSSGGGTLRRAPSTSMDRKRRSSYASNSRLSSAGYV